jgi:hypothetical protein
MKLLFAFAFLFFSLPAFAQSSVDNKIDALQKKIDTLDQRTDEKNYVRIPRNDFDNIIDNKVNAEVRSVMHEWQWLIGAVLTVLSFLAVFFFKSQLKSEVATNVNAIEKRLADKIDSHEKEIGNNIDAHLDESLSVFWDDLANYNIQQAEARGYKGADLKESLEKLLNTKTITLKDDMKVKVIDALGYYYFYSDDKDKTQKMISLVKKYEDDLHLATQTYANLAIAFTNNYNLYGIMEDRVNALEYCDKSIRRVPDYGTSYALKLEINAMYYVKGTADEKEEAKKCIYQTFHEISINKSADMPLWIIERLKEDEGRVAADHDNHVASLKKLFTSELNELRQRAMSYLMNNYNSVLNSEDKRYVNLLNYLLLSGMQDSPSIDGKWTAVNILSQGNDVPLQEGSMQLQFSKANYSFVAGETEETGIAYFIPPEVGKPLAINFYALLNNTVSAAKNVLYKIDQGSLLVCYGSANNIRPAELTSTAENRNTLITYKKLA